MRWRHPHLGMLLPATFIPIAEKSGLMISMGDWALQQACKDAAGWRSNIRVAVNLSVSQFDRRDLTSRVQHALDASGLEAGRLESTALATAFPDASLVAWKGSLGHTLGSCGLVELALACEAIRDGRAPGTVGGAAPAFHPNDSGPDQNAWAAKTKRCCGRYHRDSGTRLWCPVGSEEVKAER